MGFLLHMAITIFLAEVEDGIDTNSRELGDDGCKTDDEVLKCAFNAAGSVVDELFPDLRGIVPDLLSFILPEDVQQHQVLVVECKIDLLRLIGVVDL